MSRPRYHLLTTIPLAAFAARKWGPMAAAGALCGGLLIDADHLLDYAWTRVRNEKSHYLAPLHAWELVLALGVAGRTAVQRARRRAVPDRWVGQERLIDSPGVAAALVGLALGMGFHLVVDVVGNRPEHPWVYSLAYRLRHGFKREATGWTEQGGFHDWSALEWHEWWKAF
jgi:hypothetical protein